MTYLHGDFLFDTQNELLPASDRVPSQTKKKPTGPFDRKHLLNHLKSQAEKSTIGDDYIPFVKKQPPKETPAAAKPEPKKITTEFDDMLGMLDEDDLTELACRWSLRWSGFWMEVKIDGMVGQALR